MPTGQFLRTVGLEIEGVGKDRASITNLVNNRLSNNGSSPRLTVFRDASTEWSAYRIRVKNSSQVYLASAHSEYSNKLAHLRATDNITMGYEIITHALELPQMEEMIYPLLYGLQGIGDYPSYRSAIHIHVGYTHHLRFMKNMLRICLALDPVLYRLGGMGGKNRGFINNFAYARPLLNAAGVVAVPARRTSNGPILEEAEEESPRGRKKYVQVINPMAALEAVNVDEFWSSFGYSDRMGECKYHPMRYTGCNFYSIRKHGTMEFRHFNSSHNPHLVMAIVRFLRAAVELSTTFGKNDTVELPIIDSNSEISTQDGMHVINDVFEMCIKKDIEDLPSDFDMNLIEKYLELSSFLAIPTVPVATHIKDVVIPQDIADMGNLKVLPKVLPNPYVDIHNIKLLSLIREGE